MVAVAPVRMKVPLKIASMPVTTTDWPVTKTGPEAKVSVATFVVSALFVTVVTATPVPPPPPPPPRPAMAP